MAKVIKDITVSWSWSGDTYAIQGFNVAITPSSSNPKTNITVTAMAPGNVTSYKFSGVTLDDSVTYTAWVQAIYSGADSDWVSTGNISVTDDGNATIASKASVTQVRTDLRLTAPLPTTLAMDANGITATTTGDINAYARLDYRGLYVAKGAIQIDSGVGGVSLSGANGLIATQGSGTNRVKISLNATDGMKIQKSTDSGATFPTTTFNVDSNGNINLSGNITMLSGSKIQWSSTGNAQTPINYLNSREQSLVTNGNAQLKDNTNFTGFTFDATDSPDGTTGSFKYYGANVSGAAKTSDEIIPINTSETYTLGVYLKAGTEVATQYLYAGLAPYDIDGNAIDPGNYMYLTGTTTTLAQALKPGDTTVYLTSVTGWNNAVGTSTYMRKLIFWNYANSLGYAYPVNTYSRNVTASDTWADGAINTAAKTITLRSAWTGTTIAAGTSVSQGSSGNGYMYSLMANSVVPTSWMHYSATISGIQDDGNSAITKFPPGTAGVKILFLPNFGSATNATLKIASVQLTSGVTNNNFNADNITSMIVNDGNALSFLSNNIDLTGKVKFSSLDPNNEFFDIFTKSPDGLTTEIDGGRISTNTIVADDAILWDGLTILNSTGSNTFVVGKNPFTGASSPGDVWIQGTVQSLNYAPKSAGWQIKSDGTAEFNGATFRGNIEAGYVNNGVYTANAGVYTGGTSSREVRFWAGSDPTSAPFKVYSNGDLVATQGVFSGTFSGKVTVGNITIEDDTASNNMASIIIADNSNTPKITFGESAAIFNTTTTFSNGSSNFLVIDSVSKKMTIGSAGDMVIDYNLNSIQMKNYTIASTNSTTALTFTSTGSAADDFVFTNQNGDADLAVNGAVKVTNSITVNGKVTMRKALDINGNPVGLDFVIN